jgi:hypothetical protein
MDYSKKFKIQKEFIQLCETGNKNDLDNFFQDKEKVHYLDYYNDLHKATNLLIKNNKIEEVKTIFSYLVNLQLVPKDSKYIDSEFLKTTIIEAIKNQNTELINFVYEGKMEEHIKDEQKNSPYNIIQLLKTFSKNSIPSNPSNKKFISGLECLYNASKIANKEIFEVVYKSQKAVLTESEQFNIYMKALCTNNNDYIEYVGNRINISEKNINTCKNHYIKHGEIKGFNAFDQLEETEDGIKIIRMKI